MLDDKFPMARVLERIAKFFREESCGQCVPCRVGTVQMHHLLSRIAQGRAAPADRDRLVQLCNMVRETSLCGLGQTAPNPVLSTLRYFAHEYDALLRPEPPADDKATVPLPVV